MVELSNLFHHHLRRPFIKSNSCRCVAVIAHNSPTLLILLSISPQEAINYRVELSTNGPQCSTLALTHITSYRCFTLRLCLYTQWCNKAVYYISRESKTTRNVLWSRASVCLSVCLCVCLSVCLSAAACLQYCTDPDVTWGSGRGCPLVVHYWADLQSVHGMHCYDNIMEMRGRAQR